MGITYRSKKYRKSKNFLPFVQRVFMQYKYKAKKKEHSFELTLEQFTNLITQKCYLCGSPPANVMRRKEVQGALIYQGVDRINNDIGYTVENSRPCCMKCNAVKSNKSLEQTIKHVSKIFTYTHRITFARKK